MKKFSYRVLAAALLSMMIIPDLFFGQNSLFRQKVRTPGREIQRKIASFTGLSRSYKEQAAKAFDADTDGEAGFCIRVPSAPGSPGP